MNALELVKMMASNYRYLPVDVKEVHVTSKVHARSEQSQCFNNAFRVVLHEVSDDSTKYVLGFLILEGGAPIEHAWVKHGDTYVDVTLAEKYMQRCEYISVAEFTFREVSAYVNEKHHAPGLYEMERFLRTNKSSS
jgi:hypothetical protein